MLLFAAHDPGAKNLLGPVFEHALRLGESAEFLDLSARNELLDYDQSLKLVSAVMPELLICGTSLNQGEWPLLRACKCLGIRTAVMLEIGALGKLDQVPPADFPDRFMVTNLGTMEELIEYGAKPETVELTGSAHLEVLSEYRSESSGLAIRMYGLPSNDNLVSFFCAPDTDRSVEAVVSLATLLPTTRMEHPKIVVRPHPRTTEKHKLETATRQFEHVLYDAGEHISNADLLVASRFSLTMASTVSIESLVLGTPSAFYQIGWDYRPMKQLYRHIDAILRIRSFDALKAFVESALGKEDVDLPNDPEHYRGALGRIWRVIQALREDT